MAKKSSRASIIHDSNNDSDDGNDDSFEKPKPTRGRGSRARGTRGAVRAKTARGRGKSVAGKKDDDFFSSSCAAPNPQSFANKTSNRVRETLFF